MAWGPPAVIGAWGIYIREIPGDSGERQREIRLQDGSGDHQVAVRIIALVKDVDTSEATAIIEAAEAVINESIENGEIAKDGGDRFSVGQLIMDEVEKSLTNRPVTAPPV